jgi:hypothetical protein
MSVKPISNLRKLKYIEKAVQRDRINREKIRADGLRELGFYSSPILGPWVNPVGNLYTMLLQVKPKRRAAIFRLGRAALKQNALVKIQTLGTPYWIDLKLTCGVVNFESEFKHGDLRKVPFSTPEADAIQESFKKIKDCIAAEIKRFPEVIGKLLAAEIILHLEENYVD